MDVTDWMKGYIRRTQVAPDRAVLIKEGEPAKVPLVILKGQAKVQKRTSRGWITVDTLTEGAVIGEMQIIAPALGAGSATIVADGPITVGLLDVKRIEAEIEALSGPLKEVLRALVFRLREATEDLGLAVAER